ncbi:hypothetical protein SAZ10_20375 [Mesorhizobium sp. BAC0120]|uniref:hypothetical protein n=1 Tax=Mesorhizobium sp. BAC0120 TaxID=3090670 RepID=UPI00298D131D|nr:hypothetical protein [Mesorhizobium sp. BAC0120]MDW6024108.1 hypothetical protein [Mesorhizobium sp. BAC0120]
MRAPEWLKEVKPLILTPCFGGLVTAEYATSALKLTGAMIARGMTGRINLWPGSSLITQTRNDALAYFLSDSSLTHVIWIDADIGFEPDSALRLLLTDKDVVAGAYPQKRFWPVSQDLYARLTPRERVAAQLRYPVNGLKADGSMLPLQVDEDGLLEVTEAPAGFMCIRRTVLEKMITAYPTLKYVPDGPPDPVKEAHCYRFFDVMVEPETNRYLSEDFAFCRRWRDLGGKIFIDTTACLRHVGTHVYEGDFAAALRVAPANAVGGPPNWSHGRKP